MARLAAVALMVLAFAAQDAAAGTVDVVSASDTAQLSGAANGSHTATLALSNVSDSTVVVVPSARGCRVEPRSFSLDPGFQTAVTLTLPPACGVKSGTAVTLRFRAPATQQPLTLALQTPAAGVRWPVIAKSFGFALIPALAIVALLFLRIRQYNRLKPVRHGPEPNASPPAAKRAGDGPLEGGTYVYAIATVRHGWQTRHFPWWRVESLPTAASNEVVLPALSAAELLIHAAREGVYERRIYRAVDGGTYRRVGEVNGRATSAFVDGWNPVGATSQLKGLGTNWSFKDNWIANVTVGATVLAALFASSSTFGDVIGPAAKPALTAMAVAAALAAIFVGLGPLIVKAIGSDLSYTTVGGMLAAAFVTLFGTIGQVMATTWEVWLATSTTSLRIGAIVIAVAVGAVVLGYAERTLWYYIKTGALPVERRLPGLAGQEAHNALL